MSLTAEQILAADRAHIWHPYAGTDSSQPLYPVKSANGCVLTLHDGTELVDGMSSWWSTIHGYNHPRLNAAAQAQLADMAHVMFGGLTHEPATKLAQTLVQLTPPALERVFLADSGSVSVEVAMKMAIQFQLAQGKPDKHRFVSLRNGYHGDTLGAMSVCDPVTGMHHLFSGVLPQQFFVDAPQSRFDSTDVEADLNNMEQMLEQHHEKIAAVILEPVVQGAGGMRMYSPLYLRGVKQLCEQFDVLLIADEIATGFGRSGKMFACEHADICPDILCLGKALTGGYMTLAATLCTNHIAQTICSAEPGVFMHGPTFMGNPLACAVANASLELLLESPWQQRIAHIENQLKSGLEPCRALTTVADVRVLGAIGVVELKKPVDMKHIVPAIVAEGVWLRPFGKLLYTMPPYIMSDDELQKITGAMYKLAKHA